MNDERVPPALRSTEPPPAGPKPDPLRYCVFTTVALLAWAGGPFVVAPLAALGLVAYGRTVGRGQQSTRCLLRDTRLVLAYLGLAFVLAIGAAARTVTG